MNRNFSRELDALIEKNKRENIVPKLMLHACCACCASYVLEYLSPHFDIYLLFYNPNITEESEHSYRKSELRRLIDEMKLTGKVTIVDCEYTESEYLDLVKGLENEPERGSRCSVCFDMRLKKTAQLAKDFGCDYFATTLTISPMKNSSIINSIGERVGESVGVSYLPTDFKKKNGYKRSIELSKEYNLYRQNYCGCVFSK
ncbi:MAG: epoxyqueuosine reductase QueH [Ruminococcus sp.]|nr:epoxyqueuosine reductase QueH [Ruminococcus sp.]